MTGGVPATTLASGAARMGRMGARQGPTRSRTAPATFVGLQSGRPRGPSPSHRLCQGRTRSGRCRLRMGRCAQVRSMGGTRACLRGPMRLADTAASHLLSGAALVACSSRRMAHAVPVRCQATCGQHILPLGHLAIRLVRLLPVAGVGHLQAMQLTLATISSLRQGSQGMGRAANPRSPSTQEQQRRQRQKPRVPRLAAPQQQQLQAFKPSCPPSQMQQHVRPAEAQTSG